MPALCALAVLLAAGHLTGCGILKDDSPAQSNAYGEGNGKVVFCVLGAGPPVTIEIEGVEVGTLESYFDEEIIPCAQPTGVLAVIRPAGTYAYEAADGVHRWSYFVVFQEGLCGGKTLDRR